LISYVLNYADYVNWLAMLFENNLVVIWGLVNNKISQIDCPFDFMYEASCKNYEVTSDIV